jgi:hypothetical protein
MKDLIKEATEYLEKKGYPGFAHHTIAPRFMADFAKIHIMNILDEYTAFLQKNGYMDTDATCEEPYAIDEFLKSRK